MSKYRMDNDKIYGITKRNMQRQSVRNVPYVGFHNYSGPDEKGSDTTWMAGSRTHKQRQDDKLFRKSGISLHDRGDEDPMAGAKRLKRSSGKTSPKR